MPSPSLAEIILRPELSLGPNPFIEAIPPYVPFTDWGERLPRFPLIGADWRQIPPIQREALFSFLPQHFASDRTLFAPAHGIQQLIRQGLVQCNPLLSEERKRRNRIALCEGYRAMGLFAVDAGGGILAGPTGSGKTRLVKRVLEILIPEQVIVHGPSAACGWTKLVQPLYLYIDFPSNGSRSGLLLRVLEVIDSVLGTNYFDQHKKRTTLDVLLTVVCGLLSTLRVALVVIDEKQQTTFDENVFRIEFALLYLGLMNLGTATLLVGNPLAFVNISIYSQVVRRFSYGGIHRIYPATSVDEPWWGADFVPQMRDFTLVENVAIEEAVRQEIELRETGGLRGLFASFQHQAQAIALRRGVTSATLTEDDLHAAAKSEAFLELKRIALAAQGDPGALDAFVDFPGEPTTPEGGAAGAGTGKDGEGASVRSKADWERLGYEEVARLARENALKQTRFSRNLLRELDTFNKASPEDIRRLGVTKEHLAAVRRLRDEMTAKKPPRKCRGGKQRARGKAAPRRARGHTG